MNKIQRIIKILSLEITSWQILSNTVEVKKRAVRAIDRFRKKLMIPDSEISMCPEHEVKSKIGTIFTNEKNTWKIDWKKFEKKLILIFMSIMKKKKNW